MFKNAVSKIFIVLAVLTSALVTLSFVDRSNASEAELSLPARPMIIHLPGSIDLSDYFLRHSESNTAVSSASDLSDFYSRHTDWAVEPVSVGVAVTGANDLSDYYQRFKAMKSVSTAVDTSDYFIRHSTSGSGNPSIDTSDYFLRHPKR